MPPARSSGGGWVGGWGGGGVTVGLLRVKKLVLTWVRDSPELSGVIYTCTFLYLSVLSVSLPSGFTGLFGTAEIKTRWQQ